MINAANWTPAADPLVGAGIVIALGFFSERYVRRHGTRTYFIVQLLIFTLMTALMVAGGVLPNRPGATAGPELRRLLADAVEIFWWLAAAWLATGFLRAFVVLERQPRQSKLVQDLLAALIYVAAGFAIVAYVFDLPVKGLLATSGVLAIVIGLALQNSLGDVFSGIVLNIERPYHIGDWIILDDSVQGKVIETNWRATHILTGNQDVAIVPNSIVAKSKLVNCSTPTQIHGASIRVKLEPSLTPAAGRKLLNEVLLGSAHILRTPEPSVTIKDVSAEMIDFEVSYSVADVGSVGVAQNELFDQIYRAAGAAGARFSPRLSGVSKSGADDKGKPTSPEHLLAGISLFSSLSAEESQTLASHMKRKTYKPGDQIVKLNTVLQSLYVVAYGFLIAYVEEDGRKLEVTRLAPGDYFGEYGLLTGEALNAELNALTRVVVYEISKDALAPLLKARPSICDELSESVAKRQLARNSVLERHHQTELHEAGLAEVVAAKIRRIFSLRAAAGTGEQPGPMIPDKVGVPDKAGPGPTRGA
jgi:small-conductance mechanosensitive channel/CRP-like cAMP-binding protein